MKEVAANGLSAGPHLRGDIYEVWADGDRAAYRILFATQGARGQILLALEAIRKKTQKTPERALRLAERRLQDWRSRRSRPYRS